MVSIQNLFFFFVFFLYIEDSLILGRKLMTLHISLLNLTAFTVRGLKAGLKIT